MIRTGAAPDLVRGTDGRARCWWAVDHALLESSHDHGWGREARDESSLFERLSLEASHAGSSSATSIALARHLRALGWRLVGPVTAYASLRAAGWIGDYLVDCHVQLAEGPGSALR